MKINELRDGMGRVDIEAKVQEISEPREVQSRATGEALRIAEATISDDTGSIKLALWNEQIDRVRTNDTIRIQNGYVRSFRGEIQLNIGRYGTLTVL